MKNVFRMLVLSAIVAIGLTTAVRAAEASRCKDKVCGTCCEKCTKSCCKK